MRALALAVLCVLASQAQTAKLGGNEPTDLYDANDKIELLNNLTFRTQVYNKPNVWLVEFYNSWCGFCQRFAPTWKTFAASVHRKYIYFLQGHKNLYILFYFSAWKDIVSIGAVDCAKNENNPLCRDLEIMSYPTLRVFPLMTKSGDLGADLQSEKNLASIKGSLLDYIEKEQLEGRGTQGWPTLIPYRFVFLIAASQVNFYLSSGY